MIRILKISLFILFVYSCKKDTYIIKNNLIGSWAIDTLLYNDNDLRLTLNINIIELKKNKALLPVSYKYRKGYYNSDTYGKWEVNYKDSVIKIDFKTINPIFKGINKLCFYDDKNKRLLRIKIKSDSLYLTGTKIMYFYNSNKESRKKLMNYCNKY